MYSGLHFKSSYKYCKHIIWTLEALYKCVQLLYFTTFYWWYQSFLYANYAKTWFEKNKANLRDLIAATGLVIPNWIQIVNFSPHVTVKFDGWPCKTIGHLFYATSSFVHHFVPIGEFKLELQFGNAQSGSNSEPCDLEIWRMTLQNNKAPFLCYFKLCASFRTHWWIQTRVTVRKRPIWVKFDDF